MSGKYYVWHIVFKKKKTKANHLFWAFVKEGIIRADQLLLIWMGWHSAMIIVYLYHRKLSAVWKILTQLLTATGTQQKLYLS